MISYDTLTKRSEWLFIVLAGFFITNAVTAELISNKLIDIPLQIPLGFTTIGPFTTVIGVVLWPVIFLITDLINEFYGPKVIRKLSWITSGLIAYCFIIVIISMAVPANTAITPDTATDAEFNKVFGQSRYVIVGSILAFMVSQLLDATLFTWIKNKTGTIAMADFWKMGMTNYSLKLTIAIGLTPVIYLTHGLVRRYLNKPQA